MKEMFHSGTACLAMLALASTVAFAADGDSTPEPDSKATPSLESKELSRPPLSHIEYPPDRPTWLKNAPQLDDRPNTWVIVTAPAETIDECRAELALHRRAAVAAYIKLKSQSGRFDFYPINDEWIDQRLVSRTYQGTVKMGGTEHHEMAVELTFPTEVQSEILNAWTQINVRDRLAALGVIVLMGLTVLICASMFLCLLSRRATKQDSLSLAA